MIRRRKPIRYKRRVRRVAFNSGKVREDSTGMARLRSEAFERSAGHCECHRVSGEFPEGTAPCGGLPVRWIDGQLHHSNPRSDEIDRVSFLRRRCHDIITGELQWSRMFTPDFRQIEDAQ